MPHTLDGEFQSFLFKPGGPVTDLVNDDPFTFTSVDPKTGKISATHKGKTIDGQVVQVGASFAVVMEHDELTGTDKRRYEGALVVDVAAPRRVVIIGRKSNRVGVGGRRPDADAAQDDGTWIMTLP